MAKLTKGDVVAAVAAKTDMSKAEVARVADAMIEEITSQLASRNEVAFTGFGTFSTSDRAARQGVNPATGEKIQIAATVVPKFKAGKGLKDAVKASM